ncbi:MAG TPA: hypothetical protein VLI46_01815, partial [Ramlibacter sp.]|nr:hypothetical protein [Ramlibacter sp.]
PLVVAAIALGAVVAGTAAHARSDVILSIGLNAPHAYVQPAPVYVQPQPVYAQPQPVYVQPRPTYAPVQTVYYGHDRRDDRRYQRNGAYGDWDRDGVPNRFDRDSRFYDHRAARNHAAWGDADRDGVVNKFDRAPHNPNRR